MFTGLVEEMGEAAEVRYSRSGRSLRAMRLTIKAPLVSKDTKVGDSIAVNGCCLTVVKKARSLLSFEAGSETLSRTAFSRLQKGDALNLERAMKLDERLGGHLVTGHIDGLGTLLKRRNEDNWAHFTFRAESRLLRQLASKGSIAVDGVSLTIVTAESDRFSVALIPYTLAHTTLGRMDVGDVVNLETDLLAKYVERQLKFHTGSFTNQ